MRVAYLSGVVFFGLIPASVPAQAPDGEDFTRRDRTALLYSTKFQFTQDNIPIVTVGIAEGEKSVSFAVDGPVEFLPEGDGGPVLRLGKDRTECTATLAGGTAGSVRYWVALGRAADLESIRRERASWEARGIRVRGFERGSVFGFYGRVLDNRVQVLVEDAPLSSTDAARGRISALARETGARNLEIFEETVARPTGVVRVICQGVEARLDFPGMVALAGAEGRTVKVRNVEFGKGFSWHGREDRTYRGLIVLTVDRRGMLAVVNAVDAEALLKGLVPSEIYVDAPPEALKVQAVCARGELFAKLGTRHTADPFRICGDVHCQAYRGASREDPRTSRAVDATRGEMPFAGGRLVDSVYGASCGGHTEAGSAVWLGSDHDYLKGVADGPDGVPVLPNGADEASVRTFIDQPPAGLYCGSTKYGRESFRWQRTLSAAEVRAGVREQTGTDPGDVSGLAMLDRGVSGRVTRLEVAGASGKVVLSPELAIRKALGGLKSSLFVFEADRDPSTGLLFRFRGAGFGHGVGMCQVGAIGRADQGQDYKTILKAYYPGSEVVKIY
jgi:SpoIID/LytB domain protein